MTISSVDKPRMAIPANITEGTSWVRKNLGEIIHENPISTRDMTDANVALRIRPALKYSLDFSGLRVWWKEMKFITPLPMPMSRIEKARTIKLFMAENIPKSLVDRRRNVRTVNKKAKNASRVLPVKRV